MLERTPGGVLAHGQQPNAGAIAVIGTPLQPGSVVQVRGRRWLVEDTDPIDGLPIIRAACIDDDAQGEQAHFIWDAEVAPVSEGDEAWERLGGAGIDQAATFAAYLQTVRWSTATAADRSLFQAPFRAGIRLSAYQLAPLDKALSLPRVNLLVADDVGLGKTIEAGLIVRELLLRRRLDFFVVVAPPAMAQQWRDELATKFGLAATIVDREWVARVRRRRGFTANPWATGSAFILSNRLLIDDNYVAGLRELLGPARARTLLILDEAHHAAPASGSRYAIDSQLTRAVRDIAPRFEHRLFLTATPHNGHSNAFAALLEMLDPQRFTRGIKVLPKQLEPIMVRRLKSDLRAMGEAFPERIVEAIRLKDLPEDAPELTLARLLDAYGEQRERRLERLTQGQAQAARLVFCGLQQRLLSSIAAFAKTLKVHRQGLTSLADGLSATAPLAVAQAYATGETEIDDDIEGASEEQGLALSDAEAAAAASAATRIGGMQAEAAELAAEIALVDAMLALAQDVARQPDARVDWLIGWIEQHLRPDGAWNDRRLILFTEYEDTRRWLERQLYARLREDPEAGRIRTFTGATPADRREEIKDAFNTDPAVEPVRILVCTDAAREGLNLQTRCYDLIHVDLPWNPSRLEQRNGRIDRKLQPAKQVFCRYFVYVQRASDRVLEALVTKTETIRQELGAIGEVIEARLVEPLLGGIRQGQVAGLIEVLKTEAGAKALARMQEEMDDEVERRRERLADESARLRGRLEKSQRRVGVDPAALAAVTHAALGRIGADAVRGEAVGPVDTFTLDPSQAAFAQDTSWADLFDELRRHPRRRGERLSDWRARVPVRRIAFEPPIEADGRDADDVAQMHLEHRLVRRLLGRFQAQGFQAGLERVCVLLTDKAKPRVVLLGRICLYGPGAARLHEELIPITAEWNEQDQGKGPLTPYKETGEETTIELLERALQDARAAPEGIQQRLAAAARAAAAALRPELTRRAEVRAAQASAELAEIARSESKALRELLAAHRARIAASVRDFHPELDLTGEERRQQERDRAHWQERLRAIEGEIATEPAKVLERYHIKATRIEPIGVVYLWPATG